MTESLGLTTLVSRFLIILHLNVGHFNDRENVKKTRMVCKFTFIFLVLLFKPDKKLLGDKTTIPNARERCCSPLNCVCFGEPYPGCVLKGRQPPSKDEPLCQLTLQERSFPPLPFVVDFPPSGHSSYRLLCVL